jgi:hypothetical protein
MLTTRHYHLLYVPSAPAPPTLYPQIASNSSGSTSVGATQIATAFPSGVTAGNLLLLFVARLNAMTMTWPSGWTPLVTNTANDSAFEVRWRAYQAGDTSPTITGTASAYVYRMLRISGHHPGTAPEASTLVTGTSTTPNPGSLDPAGWGTESTLWISAQSNAGTSAPSAYPADYGGVLANAGSFGPALALAMRESTTSSQDPGTFTLPASQVWAAVTIAIRPAPVISTSSGFMMFF